MAWDHRHMEQSLITPRDGIVRVVAYPKLAVLGLDISELLQQLFPDISSPPIPPQFEKMTEIGQIISNQFKAKEKLQKQI